MPLITLLCLCLAQHVSGTIMPRHQELATIELVTTVSRVAAGWKLSAGRMDDLS